MRSTKFPIYLLLYFSLLITIIVSHNVRASNLGLLRREESGEITGFLAGSAQAVAVQGEYAYVGFESDFAIIDISDKTAPVEIGRLNIGELVRKIAVLNQYAYIATNSGLQVVDVSDPQNPEWLNRYAQTLVTQVQIRGENAYILSSSGLEILSLLDAPNLALIGHYEKVIPSPLDLDLIGKYIFIRDGYPNDLLHIIDISIISSPLLLHTREAKADRISVTQDRYLTVNNACSSICFSWFTVSIWNSNNWEFTFVGVHDVYGSAWTHALEANKLYAYAGKDIGLFVYDIYQQGIDGSPLQTDYFLIGDVQDIVATDQYIYATSTYYNNFSDPPHDGGLFILPAPPITTTYLPIVAQNN